MLAAVAVSVARREADAPAISVSAAGAALVIRPADSPDRTRPRYSHPTLGARMNTTVLSTLKPRAAVITGLRPTWSETRPANNRVARTATA